MRFVLCLICMVQPAWGDILVPTRVIQPRMLITADAVTLRATHYAGGLSDLSQVIGKEARVALYPGRPIRPQDIGAPALIERNEIVPLVFAASGLDIKTEGRAMGRGAVGERVKVMNLASRTMVMGVIRADRTVVVSQ